MSSRLTIVALTLLLAVPASGQDLPEQAMDAYRRGDFTRAAALFNQAADEERDANTRAELRVKLAWTYFAMRQTRRAEEALTAALDDVPRLELVPDFYTDDFLALFARIKERRATPEDRGAGRIVRTPSPTLAAVRQKLLLATDDETLATVLFELEQLEQSAAVEQLPDILDVKAELMDRMGRTAAALELRGRSGTARASAQAPPGTPAGPPLEILLEGRRLLAGQRAADAAALMRGVLAVQPSSLPALEILGQAHLEAGQYEEAQLVLRTAAAHSERGDILMLLGETELRRKDLPAARAAFRRAAELERGNDRAAAALGLLAAQLGDLAGARQELDRALQLNGTLLTARLVRAQIALLDGQPAAAVAHLQRALQVAPGNTWAVGLMGAAELAAGQAEAAVRRLRTAVDGGETGFRLHLAEAQRRTGQAESALQTAGDDSPAALVRALCLLDLGLSGDAEATLRSALDLDPGNTTLRALLGVTLHRQRRWQDAQEELQRITAGDDADWARAAVPRLRATSAAQDLMDAAVPVLPPAARR